MICLYYQFVMHLKYEFGFHSLLAQSRANVNHRLFDYIGGSTLNGRIARYSLAKRLKRFFT
jgi:hypothetical protein